MNCKEIKEHLLEYVDGTLPSNDCKNTIEGHLKTCSSCKEEHASLAQLMHEISEMEVIVVPDESFWKDMTAHVQSIVEKENKRQYSLWFRIQEWFRSIPIASPLQTATACAAVVIVFVFFFAFLKRGEDRRETPSLLLEQVVHQTDLSDTEGVVVLLDILD